MKGKPQYVVYRKWKEKPHTCIAFLPGIKAGPSMVMTYEADCEHAEASYTCYEEFTKSAGKRECKELHARLETLHGPLEVRDRLPKRSELWG